MKFTSWLAGNNSKRDRRGRERERERERQGKQRLRENQKRREERRGEERRGEEEVGVEGVVSCCGAELYIFPFKFILITLSCFHSHTCELNSCDFLIMPAARVKAAFWAANIHTETTPEEFMEKRKHSREECAVSKGCIVEMYFF